MGRPISRQWALERTCEILDFYKFKYTSEERTDIDVTGKYRGCFGVINIIGLPKPETLVPEDDWVDEFGEGYLIIHFRRQVWFHVIDGASGSNLCFFKNGLDLQMGAYEFVRRMGNMIRRSFVVIMNHHIAVLPHEFIMNAIS